MKNKNPHLIILILVVVLFFVIFMECSEDTNGCSRAISINDYHMSASEFEGEYKEAYIKEDAPDARQAFLDSLITRKLILQEAQRIGLDKKRNFLDTIERFWEQNLLKLMVEYKTQQIAKTIVVSQEEVDAAYMDFIKTNEVSYKTPDEIKESIQSRLVLKKQSMAVNNWIKGLRESSSVQIDQKAIGVE